MTALARFLPAVVAFVALLAPASAAAFYGDGATGKPGADLVSADYSRLEQGDDTTDYAAISADGRYVTIQTRARNFFADDDPDPPGGFRAGGVFRFDLQTRSLRKVADGSLFDEASPSHPLLHLGALKPSISADGRYVAFSTAQQLVLADSNENLDVYVRDMSLPADAAGAFDLVSARDGGDEPAHYGPPAFPLPGSEPGADVSRGVSISADGSKVVFRTEAPSDLPASGAVDVPAGQVFVRDRIADTTTLATAERDSGSGAMTATPAGGAVAAALSADGSTVAWTGRNAAAQTRFLAGEIPDPAFLYYLWRRIGDGSGAPTRRITGSADPDDPGCVLPPPSFDRTSTGPCYGPLTDQEGIPSDIVSQVPVLSADGYTVAFLSGAAGRPAASANSGLDLFVTRMNPGLTRKAATVELTRDTLDTNIATASPLSSVALAPDGRYLAIVSARTRFVLPALQQLGEPRQVPGPQEVYVVDLQSRTLERVAHSYSGGDTDAGVVEGATISNGGDRVAFVSFAGNLLFGDANQRPDAFVATRQPDSGNATPERGPGAGGPDATIEEDRGGPQIGVRARSTAEGTVVLTVSVPAAGGVRAVAKARAGEPPEPRTLATATARARGAVRTNVRLVLRPVARYRPELRQRTISAHAAVGYVASRGGRRANASIRIAFRRPSGTAKQHSRKGAK
jgi:Tol biopolymer transport system component